MSSLNTGNWITIVFGLVGTVGVSFTAANYLTGRRERQLKNRKPIPKIKATINRKRFEGGWRSVQLHIHPAENEPQDFKYANWRIDRARLLQPSTAYSPAPKMMIMRKVISIPTSQLVHWREKSKVCRKDLR